MWFALNPRCLQGANFSIRNALLFSFPPHDDLKSSSPYSLLFQVAKIKQLWKGTTRSFSQPPPPPSSSHPSQTIWQTVHLHPSQIKPSPLHQETRKQLLMCVFSKGLNHNFANLKEPYNQVINVQVTTRNIKTEDGLFMKSSTPEISVRKVFFRFNPLFVLLVSQIIYEYPRSGSIWGKLYMRQPFKTLNY